MYKFDVSWRHQHYRPIQQHARRRRNPSGPSACPGSTPNTRQIWPHPSRAGHPTPAPVATTAAGGRADGGPGAGPAPGQHGGPGPRGPGPGRVRDCQRGWERDRIGPGQVGPTHPQLLPGAGGGCGVVVVRRDRAAELACRGECVTRSGPVMIIFLSVARPSDLINIPPCNVQVLSGSPQ